MSDLSAREISVSVRNHILWGFFFTKMSITYLIVFLFLLWPAEYSGQVCCSVLKIAQDSFVCMFPF